MFKNNKKSGFTLIELLIVIAIIGVLAATVVVSLGSQTDTARQGSVKIGVSSVRNLATVAAVEGKVGTTAIADTGTNTLCDLIYSKVSGEKTNWTWDGTNECTANGLGDGTGVVAGEICCSSPNKTTWVIWGNKDSADGAKDGKEVYCADSNGYAGDVKLAASEADGNVGVDKGKDNNPTRCITP